MLQVLDYQLHKNNRVIGNSKLDERIKYSNRDMFNISYLY